MKIRVFEEKYKEEKEVILKLIDSDGCVHVNAVDRDGNFLHCGIICSFTPRGIRVYAGINENLGFPLDPETKKIKVINA